MNSRMAAALCSVLSAVGTGLVQADEAESLALSATADFCNKYVWRGQNLNDGAVFQPSVSLDLYGFTGAAWGSLDLTDENGHRGELTEVDLSLEYSTEVPGLEPVEVSVGAIHYQYPNTDFSSTSEVYAGAGLACFLEPSAKIYYDVDEINGAYLQLAVGHTIEKIAAFRESCYSGCAFGLSLGYGSAGYNEGCFGVDENAFNDLTVFLSLPVHAKNVTISPSVNYSRLLTDEIRAATAHSDNVWAGVSITYDF